MQKKILSFNDFSKVYESDSYIFEETDPPKDDSATAIVSDDGSVEIPPIEILDILKSLGAKEDKKTKAESPNESLSEQDSAKVSTLKAAKIGEKSERVKDIQKLLGLKADGIFGSGTKTAVMKFQQEMKAKGRTDTLVDGIVGNQTYGLMLMVKKGITSQSEISAMMNKFSQAGKTVVSVSTAGTNIALDPRLYEIFEKIEIITNNGTTYVVATPKSDAADKIASLKKDGLLAADFSWLLQVPLAVGKVIVYTAIGSVLVTVEVGKAMVNAAISASSYVSKEAISFLSNTAYGLGQIGKWVKASGVATWATIKSDAASALALWKGFNDKAKVALKSSAQAALAFSAAVAASLSKATSNEALRSYTHKMAMEVGKGLNLAWTETKNLGELVKTGLSKVKDGSQVFAAKIQSEYDQTVARTKEIGNAVSTGFKQAGTDVNNALKSSVNAAGDALISAGSWLKGLTESLESGNDQLVLEWLEY